MLNQSTHSSVANSTASAFRQGCLLAARTLETERGVGALIGQHHFADHALGPFPCAEHIFQAALFQGGDRRVADHAAICGAGDEHMRDGRLGPNAASDQPRHHRRLHHHARTGPAGELRPPRHQHAELGRDDAEPLGTILADHHHSGLTAPRTPGVIAITWQTPGSPATPKRSREQMELPSSTESKDNLSRMTADRKHFLSRPT